MVSEPKIKIYKKLVNKTKSSVKWSVRYKKNYLPGGYLLFPERPCLLVRNGEPWLPLTIEEHNEMKSFLEAIYDR